jgi:hypothetical protein
MSDESGLGDKITLTEYVKRRFWERGDSIQEVVENTLANLYSLPIKLHVFVCYFDEEDDQWMAGWVAYEESHWDKLFAAVEASKNQYEKGVAELLEGVEGLLDDGS